MKMTHITLFIAALVVLSFTASAQDVTKVILATDMTSVDALVASAAGSKDGLPVLILPAGELTDDIKTELASLNAKTVIIVGGPVVVKPTVETQLESLGYKVVRLWGIERTETAVEVAKHFWPAGVDCAVLVDDTKNPTVDTNLIASAAAFAAQNECMLLPIPNGSVPANVLAAMRELNANRVRWFGRAVAAQVATALREFNATEVIGEDAAEATSTEAAETAAVEAGQKPKLVVVAALHWDSTLGIGANPNQHSVVRILSDVSKVSDIVALVEQKGITDVKVVGNPALAQDIATALTAAGIEVTKVSGEKASDVAIGVLDRNLERWHEQRTEAEANTTHERLQISDKIQLRINETEAALNREREFLEALSLNATSTALADISILKDKLDDAIGRISDVRDALDANDTETAQELLSSLKEKFYQYKWLVREQIRWDWQGELEDEESTASSMDSKFATKVADARKSVVGLSESCSNAEIVQKLVEEAHALQEAATSAISGGESAKASEFLALVKQHVETAQSIGDVCKEHGSMGIRAREVIQAQRTETAAISEVSTQVTAIDQMSETEIESAISTAVATESSSGGQSHAVSSSTGGSGGGQSSSTGK